MSQLRLIALIGLYMMLNWPEAESLPSLNLHPSADELDGHNGFSLEALWKAFKQRHGKILPFCYQLYQIIISLYFCDFLQFALKAYRYFNFPWGCHVFLHPVVRLKAGSLKMFHMNFMSFWK